MKPRLPVESGVAATPRQLVEALHQRVAGARTQLQELVAQPLGLLIDRLITQNQMTQNRKGLVVHALHSAETWLRTRPVDEFDGLSWPAFRAAVLLHVAKLASHPYGKKGDPGTAAPPPLQLPDSPGYQSQTLFLPHDQIGRYWFGGDWFGGKHASDGSLWVLLADITGHGYCAYLLAATMPAVWQSCWQALGPSAQEPAELLSAMHNLLEECLPDGIYVECTLVRLSREGAVTVSPAGGTRLILRRGETARPDLVTLRGTWLGLSPPRQADQQSWHLDEGDELVLGTDGMFDQLVDGLGPDLANVLQCPRRQSQFAEHIRQLIRQALERSPQRDDITMVALRRRTNEKAPEGNGYLEE
jgi:hypothetical protein